MLATLPQGDEVFVADGYIRVFQDVRGKYGSEGDYVMTRPLRGPLNPTARRPLDRRLRHHRLAGEERARSRTAASGMIGSSYEGFTVVMALVNPHPALKVAAPESPMVDGWMGDDWFHYGAFRQTELRLLHRPDHRRAARATIVAREGYDDYENFRRAGSAGDFAKAAGLDQLPWWRKVTRAPGLRRLLAGAGARQDHGGAAAHGADDVDSGAVGPGGHVGRDPLLPGGRAEGHGATTRTSW